MKKHAIQAYVGTPLYGADGAPLGVLAMAHRKPVERGRFWASLIEIFGARAAAEIERARAEALVRRTNESLEQVVHERTAQLEEANRDLESYNYSISHDLRQPLNAIAGFAELLREQAGAGLQTECVGEIEANTARMEQMIEALMRLGGAGRGAINRVAVDMRALAESVLRDLSAAAPLAAEVCVGELPAAMGDAVLLRQVWANLLGNALKYPRRTSRSMAGATAEWSNSRCATTASASTCSTPGASSTRSRACLRPSRSRAAASGWRSSSAWCAGTAAASARNRPRVRGRCSASRCPARSGPRRRTRARRPASAPPPARGSSPRPTGRDRSSGSARCRTAAICSRG
jgi:hypothetical protein